jgi:hypothetical protein
MANMNKQSDISELFILAREMVVVGMDEGAIADFLLDPKHKFDAILPKGADVCEQVLAIVREAREWHREWRHAWDLFNAGNRAGELSEQRYCLEHNSDFLCDAGQQDDFTYFICDGDGQIIGDSVHNLLACVAVLKMEIGHRDGRPMVYRTGYGFNDRDDEGLSCLRKWVGGHSNWNPPREVFDRLVLAEAKRFPITGWVRFLDETPERAEARRRRRNPARGNSSLEGALDLIRRLWDEKHGAIARGESTDFEPVVDAYRKYLSVLANAERVRRRELARRRGNERD